VYILTGRAAQDYFGPAAALAQLISGAVLGLVAPAAGALAAMAVARLRPGRA
jgi:hypothetical protein